MTDVKMKLKKILHYKNVFLIMLHKYSYSSRYNPESELIIILILLHKICE